MNISSNLQEITYPEARRMAAEEALHGSCWDSPETSRKQLELAIRELDQFRSGTPHGPFEAFLELTGKAQPKSLLDVACGAGYYSDLLDRIPSVEIYHGCDKSIWMISAASERWPKRWFEVQDARRLGYHARSFDLVVEGCTILHSLDWRQILNECCRVAATWVLTHRTPCTGNGRVHYYAKLAYDLPCYELHYPAELIAQHMGMRDFRAMEHLDWGHGSGGWIRSTLWKRI